MIKVRKILATSPIKVIDSKIICSDQSFKDIFPVTEKIGICFIFKVNKCLDDIFIKVKLFSSANVHIFDSLDMKGSKIFNQSWYFPKNCMDR